jgi:hypothetical protein
VRAWEKAEKDFWIDWLFKISVGNGTVNRTIRGEREREANLKPELKEPQSNDRK